MKIRQHSHQFFSFASGIAAENSGTCMGPIILQNSPLLAQLNFPYQFEPPLYPQGEETLDNSALTLDDLVVTTDLSSRLADYCFDAVKEKTSFTTIGGDHSCGIGTWSGTASALAGDLGLIWIDAHLDAHTHDTSPTGNIHGMPIAALLGHGDKQLTTICSDQIKLKPDNLYMIGMRCYEEEEKALLENLGVRIAYIEEVHQRGIDIILQEAINHVTQNTVAYGVSVDLDGIDPKDAPAVGTPVEQGVDSVELCQSIKKHIQGDSRLIGTEISEFNPSLDQDHKTEQVIIDLLNAFYTQIT